MAEDAVALYGLAKKQLESMNQREAELQASTAALLAAVAELKALPFTLGKQTSQYIAIGVREAIADDFSRPIAEAVKGPIADLSREAYHAKSVISQVAKYERFHTWTWLGMVFGLGFLLGLASYHLMAMRNDDAIREQLNVIQQQTAPAALVLNPKTADSKTNKGHKER